MIISINTDSNKIIGVIRIILGIIFIMTGVMKLTMAEYSAAWSIQLIEADIPMYAFNFWFVPLFEIVLGLFLLVGVYPKISALAIIYIMIVAIYVHLTVTRPTAFPSQSQEPYMPIMVIIMAIPILIKRCWKLECKLKNSWL